MSESSLVTYRNLTNNKTVVKDKKNNYIIPHVYVGQVSTKNGVDHFTTNCGASCTYVIGTDGTIGQSVSEADRPWTTGGDKEVQNQYGLWVGGTPSKSQAQRGAKGVDYEAITMEIACDPTAPYAINDKVYNSLVNLMADIAIRNNMGELKWKADKNLVGNPSEQNVLVHRWFASKSCPGDYVYNKLGEICEKANQIIREKTGKPVYPSEQPQPTPTPQPTLYKDDKYVWDKLKAVICNDFGVAGLMGNLQAESGVRSNNLQNSFEKSLGMSDDVYTKAVDENIYTNFVKDSAGYGLAQWTYWSRKQNLLDYAKTHNKSIGDLAMQVDFLIIELKQYKDVWAVLQTATSVKQASDVVLTQYERPRDQTDKVKEQRASYGLDFYNKYACATPTPVKPAEPEKTEVVYTVRAGDTLSAIARKYNTTYQKIAKDNNIPNPNIIYIGQKLVIK
jgi:LysM repeat protein